MTDIIMKIAGTIAGIFGIFIATVIIYGGITAGVMFVDWLLP